MARYETIYLAKTADSTRSSADPNFRLTNIESIEILIFVPYTFSLYSIGAKKVDVVFQRQISVLGPLDPKRVV